LDNRDRLKYAKCTNEGYLEFKQPDPWVSSLSMGQIATVKSKIALSQLYLLVG
jgi:hypothetical protein